MESKNKNLKEEMLKKSIDLLSKCMPRNTNWYSLAARKRAAELIIGMVFENYGINKKNNRKKNKR